MFGEWTAKVEFGFLILRVTAVDGVVRVPDVQGRSGSICGSASGTFYHRRCVRSPWRLISSTMAPRVIEACGIGYF